MIDLFEWVFEHIIGPFAVLLLTLIMIAVCVYWCIAVYLGVAMFLQ